MKLGTKRIIGGACLLVLAAAITPAAIAYHLLRADPSSQQFQAPGVMDIDVQQPGRYYVWNEYQTIYEGRVYDRSEELPDGMQITITKRPSGKSIALVGRQSISSSSGPSSKRSIGYIDLETPASLRIEVSGLDDERVIGFSRSRIKMILLWIVAGGITASLLGLGGLGLLAWGIITLART